MECGKLAEDVDSYHCCYLLRRSSFEDQVVRQRRINYTKEENDGLPGLEKDTTAAFIEFHLPRFSIVAMLPWLLTPTRHIKVPSY